MGYTEWAEHGVHGVRITFGDHHFLGQEDLFRRDFNAQVTTGDHDPATRSDDWGGVAVKHQRENTVRAPER